MLAAVHGLLADEAGDLALEDRIGDLVAVVADGSDEEVLTVGEHGRQAGGQMAEDHVAISGEVAGQVLERRVERDATGRDGALGVARLGHDEHSRTNERFPQSLISVTLVTVEGDR